MSKIEIAIDVNGLEAKLCHWNTQKQKGESFPNFRVIPVIIVDNLDYVCTATLNGHQWNTPQYLLSLKMAWSSIKVDVNERLQLIYLRNF